MALVLIDRVQETGTANTTVSFTLSGAMTSYQSFGAIGTGNTTYYGATDGTNWEVGLGTYTTSPNTLTRTTILSSSNSGSAVTFSGTVTVWCDYPAEKQISSDYPNALGVVTPAAGTFTTITGQTEVLKGTGQNLSLQSQFASGWTGGTNVALTPNSTTAPDGTTTAALVSLSSASGSEYIYQNTTFTNGLIYTLSVYVKPSAVTSFAIRSFTQAGYLSFTLTGSGTVGSATGIASNGVISYNSATGYYRCSVSFTANATGSNNIGFDTNSTVFSGNAFYVWGAQLEIGSVTNTYIPTTTTAVYGTPTLSFSGVAGLGLQSDGSLYVSPAGTGALQAQNTTSTTTGGNARGANAVDWQTSRGSASQVANQSYSVISGGQNNYVNGSTGFLGGGSGNNVSGGGGVVVGGYSNINYGTYSSIVGGHLNGSSTQTGYFNFIGGGELNTANAQAAVTTQATTTVTSGSTAVTLSGSNASIKVGQLITGTGIQSPTGSLPFTYVAAISGTSLTLSQNASASGTPTLSFYTPHGVVVGGGNNQATGSYSFIGGGGDAGTAANRNSVVSDWGVVVGGFKNTVSATGTHNSIVGGYGNTISGGQYGSFIGGGGTYNGGSNPNTITNSAAVITGGISNNNSSFVGFIGGGYSNTANGANYSTIVGGQSNTVNSSYGFIAGGIGGTTRGITGYHVFVPHNSPVAVSQGVQQIAFLVLGRQTTDATATVLCSDSSAAGTTNQVILPNNSAYYFKGEVISGVTGGGNTKGWSIEGVIKRGANAASTALVGTPTVTSLYADAGATTWILAVTADTTNGGITVTFTGQASTTIRTVCRINTVEMTF